MPFAYQRNQVSITTAFVDLSAFTAFEAMLYGGVSVNKFKYCLRRSNWFALIHADLNTTGNSGDWGSVFNAVTSRQGDYFKNVDFWFSTPELRMQTVTVPQGDDEGAAGPGDPFDVPFTYYQLRWTRNLGHHVMHHTKFLASDMTVLCFGPHYMDFFAALGVVATKRPGYYRMIGNRDELVNPYAVDTPGYDYNGFSITALGGFTPLPPLVGDQWGGKALPEALIRVPLWCCYFARTTGNAFCQAAVPFNEIRWQVTLPAFTDVICVDQVLVIPAVPDPFQPWYSVLKYTNLPNAGVAGLIQGGVKALRNVGMSNTTVVLTNGDREMLGDEVQIQYLIEQIQWHNGQQTRQLDDASSTLTLRFTQAIKYILFGLRVSNCPGEAAVYGTLIPHPASDRVQFNALRPVLVLNDPNEDGNPLEAATLDYENVARVQEYIDYYADLVPFNDCAYTPAPELFGFNIITFCNNMLSNGPDGGSNFSRIASAQLNMYPSKKAPFVPSVWTTLPTAQQGPSQARLQVTTVVLAVNQTIAVAYGGAFGMMFQ